MSCRPWRVPVILWLSMLGACTDGAPRPEATFRSRYIQAVAGTLGATDEQKVTRELSDAIHEEIANCLDSAGFSFPPDTAASSGPPSELSNRDWVSKYGFGISTRPSSQDVPSEDNPLLKYLDSLAPSARAAFDEAFGEQGSGGCLDQGNAAARKALDIEDIDTRLNNLPPLDQFPEVQVAEQAWRDCAREAGVRADGLLQLTGSFGTRVQNLTPTDSAGLAALRQEEISTALAVFDCTVSRNKVVTEFVASRLTSPTS